MQRDLRFWVSIPELAGVSLPVGMPVWDLRDLDRRPVPVIGHSEAGPLIAVRQGDSAAFVVPGANRAICLAEPEMMDGAPLWLDALPWAAGAIVARRGYVPVERAPAYQEKTPAARWRPSVFKSGWAELVAWHKRVELVAVGDAGAGAVEVEGLVGPSDVGSASWPYGIPTVRGHYQQATTVHTADMPADAAHAAALRLTVAAALREGVLRREAVQLVGNGA